MPFLAKTLRRSGRLLALCGRWAGYLYRQPARRVALADLGAWLNMTFSRAGDPFRYDLPWISLPATRWLRAHLHPGMRVFEWGSGSSTVFFAARVGGVVSVEHDRAWYERVGAELEKRKIGNVDLRFVSLEARDAPPTGAADHRPASAYAATILDFPDAHFDAVVVDGRERAACLRAARSKVKPGGWILLDNSERAQYAAAFALFEEPAWTTTHIEGPVPRTVWPVFGRATVFTRRPATP